MSEQLKCSNSDCDNIIYVKLKSRKSDKYICLSCSDKETLEMIKKGEYWNENSSDKESS